MSERTGATAIDEYGRPYDPCDSSRAKTIIAAHRTYRAWNLPDGTGMTWYDLDDFREVGEWIIPPGHVIVAESAVPDETVRAAIRFAVEMAEDFSKNTFYVDKALEQSRIVRVWLDAQEATT